MCSSDLGLLGATLHIVNITGFGILISLELQRIEYIKPIYVVLWEKTDLISFPKLEPCDVTPMVLAVIMLVNSYSTPNLTLSNLTQASLTRPYLKDILPNRPFAA